MASYRSGRNWFPDRAKPGTILARRASQTGLTSADSGLQLDLEIALSGVSAPKPFGLKRRVTESLRFYEI